MERLQENTASSCHRSSSIIKYKYHGYRNNVSPYYYTLLNSTLSVYTFFRLCATHLYKTTIQGRSIDIDKKNEAQTWKRVKKRAVEVSPFVHLQSAAGVKCRQNAVGTASLNTSLKLTTSIHHKKNSGHWLVVVICTIQFDYILTPHYNVYMQRYTKVSTTLIEMVSWEHIQIPKGSWSHFGLSRESPA